jgi:hypothetical protein
VRQQVIVAALRHPVAGEEDQHGCVAGVGELRRQLLQRGEDVGARCRCSREDLYLLLRVGGNSVVA